MKAFVTGGAGFIGSNLVDALVARGDEVAVVDDLSTGRAENLADAIARGAVLHEADIRDGERLAGLVEVFAPEVIFHLAAQIDVRRAVADPGFDAQVNVGGTINVLEAARRAGVPRVVMVVPTPRGETNPLVLAAARLAGVDELYRVGGAQAVAALAYGTESITPVARLSAEPMTAGDRQRLIAHLEMTENWLVSELKGLSADQLKFKMTPESWSIADVVEHLEIAEPQYWQRVLDSMKQPPNTEKLTATDAGILWYGIDRTNRNKTGEARVPKGKNDAAASLGDLGIIIYQRDGGEKALPYFEQALATVERFHGPNHESDMERAR